MLPPTDRPALQTSLRSWRALSPAEVADVLEADLDSGLTDESAAEPLHHYGPNELAHHPGPPLLRRLAAQFTDPLVVVRSGRTLRVPTASLVPGDILLLAEGDLVGCDGRIIEAASAEVNEAPLTGESAPVAKLTGRRPADTWSMGEVLGPRCSWQTNSANSSAGAWPPEP